MANASVEQRHLLLNHKDVDGKIAIEVARTDDIKHFLKWTSEQNDQHYFLQSQPNVIIMYTTDGRPGAENERSELECVMPRFNSNVTTLEDPHGFEMLNTIQETIEKTFEPSALIIIIMMHGKKGYVKALDGWISIQDVIDKMNSEKLKGRPKVGILTQ